MADTMKLSRAKDVYRTICSALDNRNWKYERNEDDLAVHFTVSGEDLPMNLLMLVDADRQLIRVLSPLPFEMSESKRAEGAVAVCAASSGMVSGNFDYDINDGSILFRITSSFRSSVIGEALINYLIDCTCSMVDKYNDRFLALNKGVLALSDFFDND